MRSYFFLGRTGFISMLKLNLRPSHEIQNFINFLFCTSPLINDILQSFHSSFIFHRHFPHTHPHLFHRAVPQERTDDLAKHKTSPFCRRRWLQGQLVERSLPVFPDRSSRAFYMPSLWSSQASESRQQLSTWNDSRAKKSRHRRGMVT